MSVFVAHFDFCYLYTYYSDDIDGFKSFENKREVMKIWGGMISNVIHFFYVYVLTDFMLWN